MSLCEITDMKIPYKNSVLKNDYTEQCYLFGGMDEYTLSHARVPRRIPHSACDISLVFRKKYLILTQKTKLALHNVKRISSYV